MVNEKLCDMFEMLEAIFSQFAQVRRLQLSITDLVFRILQNQCDVNFNS